MLGRRSSLRHTVTASLAASGLIAAATSPCGGVQGNPPDPPPPPTAPTTSTINNNNNNMEPMETNGSTTNLLANSTAINIDDQLDQTSPTYGNNSYSITMQNVLGDGGTTTTITTATATMSGPSPSSYMVTSTPPGGPSATAAAAAAAANTTSLIDPTSAVGLGIGAFELDEVIRARTLWWESEAVRWFMRLCALLSLVSVSLNTSYTYKNYRELIYITFIIDASVAIVFTIELISKIRIRGSYVYVHDRWAQFDMIMLLCLLLSLILHVFEIIDYVPKFSPLSIIRAPRPLIMIRLVRVFLSFSMPRARITQIFLRSSQQIYNVTLFFLFFMSLFGLLGVQFFSRLHHHCVLVDNYTETFEPTIHHLAIPDTYCSPINTIGHQCPPTMMCREISNATGYSGFDNLAHALFTVYHSSSQEGWYHVMYQAMDSMDIFRAAFYFVNLIFFLAWLVKNVFIAVITETFNEIRVQFQQMWGERAKITAETIPSILVGDDQWRLVQLTDTDTGTKAPYFIRKILPSASFQIFVMLMIVINAMINASVQFDHSERPRHQFYTHIYPIEVFFTVFFDVEVVLKIWCYGYRAYIKRSLHKLELLLSIGSSIHIIPPLYMYPPLVYFQVLRIVRLIKASPVLEDFVYKIFGPGKKLGSLIIFTMCLLIVTSSISMQLFCSFEGYQKFQSFPDAFMSMFQILTQEGWTEVMNETILRSGRNMGPAVAIYFILYHLFVSLIVLSLFVAVILDNLELDEDVKKVKQLKVREQSAGFNEELPLRLRLFESFPDSPQMTRLHKSANEFVVPKVRDSFMRSFIDAPTTNTTTNSIANNGKIAASTNTIAGSGIGGGIGGGVGGGLGGGGGGGLTAGTGGTLAMGSTLLGGTNLFGAGIGSNLNALGGQMGPFVGTYHFSASSSTFGSSNTGTLAGLGTNITARHWQFYNGYLTAAAAAAGFGGIGGNGGANGTTSSTTSPVLGLPTPTTPGPMTTNTSTNNIASSATMTTFPNFGPFPFPTTTTTTTSNGTTMGNQFPSSSLIALASRIKMMQTHGHHNQPPIKLLNAIAKGRHASPLLRRIQVACIVSDSNNQRLLLGDQSTGGVGGGTIGTGAGAGGPGSYSRSVTGGLISGTGGGTSNGGASATAGSMASRTAIRRSVRGQLKDDVIIDETIASAAAGAGGTGGPNGPNVRGTDFDFKMLQRKRQQAEMRRTQRESDLRENHPFFDTPLLIVGRESRFRFICQSMVGAKYDPHVRDPITGKERKIRYKGAHELLGLVPYCDWIMILVTTFSCASMMCETGQLRASNTPWLVIAEYTFIIAMALELTLKTLADGLLFTPNAFLANVSGIMDFSIFAVSVLFLAALPEEVPPGSWQQTLMVLRCVRPLRIFSLVPHMRKVVYELCRGFKEIALVSVLLIVLLFVFASVGVHMFGGRLARCNDPCITKREDCVGVFMRQVHVTRMKFESQGERMPQMLVPRVW